MFRVPLALATALFALPATAIAQAADGGVPDAGAADTSAAPVSDGPAAHPIAPVPPPPAPPAAPPAETVVRARKPISAASSFSVRDRDFELRPIASVQDILRVTPGLVLVQHSGGG